jgi:Protein of unknown function (DUF3159)
VNKDASSRWLGLEKDEQGEYVLTPASMLRSIGGLFGLVESAIPPVAFSVSFGITGSAYVAAGIAVSLALVLGVIQIIRKKPVMNAIASLIGIGFAAFLATSGGNGADSAKNFFLPGLITNTVWAAGLIVSVLVRRPAIGLLLATFEAIAPDWRANRELLSLMNRATLFWSALFILRLCAQVPLYLADEAAWLGIVKSAIGLPAFALWIFLSWLLLKQTIRPAR